MGRQSLTKFVRISFFGGSYFGSYGTQEDDFDTHYGTQEDDFDTVGKVPVFKSTSWPSDKIDYQIFSRMSSMCYNSINKQTLIKNIINGSLPQK